MVSYNLRSAASGRIFHCVELMKSEYSRRWTNKSRPYAGMPELLEGFMSSGYRLNILSNKADEATQPIVAELLSRRRRPHADKRTAGSVAVDLNPD